MDKANKILIGAFLILFIGFLISYNGNMITGKFSKDVTGALTFEEFFKEVETACETTIPPCPQECIDNAGGCVDKDCEELDQEAFDKCVNGLVNYQGWARGSAEQYCLPECTVKGKKNTCRYLIAGEPPTGECEAYHGDKINCMAQNTIEMKDCEWKSIDECSGDCKWYDDLAGLFGGGPGVGEVVKDITGKAFVTPPSGPTGLSPCRPKTSCIWTNGHCCGDKEYWNGVECKSLLDTAGSLCFSFWPNTKKTGESIDYTSGKYKVCNYIGSSAYGFWVDVVPY